MSTKLRSRSFFYILTILIFVFIFNPAPLYADFDYRSGEERFDVDRANIPDYYLKQNSFYNYTEYQKGDTFYSLQDYISRRVNNRINLEAPLLIIKAPKFDLLAGSQLTSDASYFQDKTPFTGGRVSYYMKKSGVTLYGGDSGLANDYCTFNQGLIDYKVYGFAAKSKIARFTSIYLSGMKFIMDDKNIKNSSMLGALISTSPLPNINSYVSYARDFSKTKNNTFGEWSLNYNLDKLDFYGYGKKVGRDFGPPTEFNFYRGQDYQYLAAAYQFSPRFRSTLEYRYYSYNQLLTQESTSTSNSIIGNNFWRIDKKTNVRVGFETDRYSNQLGYSDPQKNYRNEISAEIRRKLLKHLDLSVEYRRYINRYASQVIGTKNHDLITSLVIPFDNEQTFRISYNKSSHNGTTSDNNNNIGIEYRKTLPNDKGYVSFNYNQSRTSIPYLNLFDRNRTSYVNFQFNPTRRFSLRGAYFSTAPESNRIGYTSYNAGAYYLLTKQSEIGITYFKNPVSIIRYIQNLPFEMKNILTLQLRTSFGGPLERDFSKRWVGDIICKFYYQIPSQGDKRSLFTKEMPPVNVILYGPDGEKYTAQTDETGNAVFEKIAAGKYKAIIEPDQLDGNLVALEGEDLEREIDLKPGIRKVEKFTLAASSSIYAVIWNDNEGTGKLHSPYVGFDKVGIILQDSEAVKSDENGVVIFKKLIPGKYSIRLDDASLPEGLEFSTDKSQIVELAAGVEKVVLFGLRGWGVLKGTIMMLPRGKTKPEPAENISISMDNKELGKTGAKGEFSFRISAGSHNISVNTISTMYVVDEKEEKLKINPNQEITRDFLLAYFASVEGYIYEMVNGKKVPYTKGIMVVNFDSDPGYVYSDKNGKFIVKNLKLGKKSFSLDKSYIPKGYTLISPESVEISPLSGEKAAIEFVIGPQTPQIVPKEIKENKKKNDNKDSKDSKTEGANRGGNKKLKRRQKSA